LVQGNIIGDSRRKGMCATESIKGGVREKEGSENRKSRPAKQRRDAG